MTPFVVLNSLVSYVKKGSLPVNSVMILVVLSTHAELASATARGCSYCETGEFVHISNASCFAANIRALSTYNANSYRNDMWSFSASAAIAFVQD